MPRSPLVMTIAPLDWIPHPPEPDMPSVGDFKEVGYPGTPAGWLECDGAAVSRVTYAALFAAIDIAFGPGDGVTTFNLPDRRGRFARGKGTGPGLSPVGLGGVAGQETTVVNLNTHHHSLNYVQFSLAMSGGTGSVVTSSDGPDGTLDTSDTGDGPGPYNAQSMNPWLGVRVLIYAGA